MRRAKIAYIATSDEALWYLLLNQIKSIQKDGHEIVGISSPGEFVGDLEREGVCHIGVPMTSRVSPLADLISLWNMFAVLKREKFDLVHTHNRKAGLIGQLAARMTGVPVVVHSLHGFYLHDRMSSVTKSICFAVERLGSRFSDAILSANREDVETALDWRVCNESKIRHVGGGISLEAFDADRVPKVKVNRLRCQLGLPEGTPIVGFVGKLAGKRKGFLDFLGAAKIIKERCPKARFLIVGSAEPGGDDAVEPSAAIDYGIASSCIFVGERSVSELPLWYSMMSVVVVPSLFEGLPRVLMEASAMGIPTVATDVKGNREAIVHERNGLLVPLGDLEKLAGAVLGILEEPGIGRCMGVEGRAIALEEFDERVIFSRIKAEYAKLLENSGERQGGVVAVG